jgi:hypothetical protein
MFQQSKQHQICTFHIVRQPDDAPFKLGDARILIRISLGGRRNCPIPNCPGRSPEQWIYYTLFPVESSVCSPFLSTEKCNHYPVSLVSVISTVQIELTPVALNRRPYETHDSISGMFCNVLRNPTCAGGSALFSHLTCGALA